jgi:hypothetical protein
MSFAHFTEQVQHYPGGIEFEQTMNFIDQHFDYIPTAFSNGPDVSNAAGINEGSCKIFTLAQKLNLSKEQTLACFGKFYREEVLQQPDADNHSNIRAFIQHGWDGITFEGDALTAKE